MTRVLVVDDDPQVLSLIGRWLSAAGYDVVLADTFKGARMEIDVRAPDIAVIDVRLADFNGLQLGLLARETRPDVRLVFISGWDDTVLRREAQRALHSEATPRRRRLARVRRRRARPYTASKEPADRCIRRAVSRRVA